MPEPGFRLKVVEEMYFYFFVGKVFKYVTWSDHTADVAMMTSWPSNKGCKRRTSRDRRSL